MTEMEMRIYDILIEELGLDHEVIDCLQSYVGSWDKTFSHVLHYYAGYEDFQDWYLDRFGKDF